MAKRMLYRLTIEIDTQGGLGWRCDRGGQIRLEEVVPGDVVEAVDVLEGRLHRMIEEIRQQGEGAAKLGQLSSGS